MGASLWLNMHKIVTYSPKTSSAGGLQTVLSTRSILVSYAGYPYTFNSLMPDNGLANLAGALLFAGHETLVLDYGTVENVEETFPSELSTLAKETYESAVRNIGKGTGPGGTRLRAIFAFGWEVDARGTQAVLARR